MFLSHVVIFIYVVLLSQIFAFAEFSSLYDYVFSLCVKKSIGQFKHSNGYYKENVF